MFKKSPFRQYHVRHIRRKCVWWQLISHVHLYTEKDYGKTNGPYYHHHHHQFLNCEGRWGTTDDFATSFLHVSLFSTALWDLPNSRPVHSLMLSSHLFLCLPCLLPPFNVLCQIVLARPDEREKMTIPLQFASLYNRQEVFVWSNCLLDLGTDFLVGNMVFVWDAVSYTHLTLPTKLIV